MKRGALLAAGAGLCTAGLGLGRSDFPAVLGRWSMVYAAIVGMAALVTLAIALYAWRTTKAGVGATQWTRSPLSWLEVAALVYGVAYLISAIGDPESASRALDLNLTGAIVPLAVLLEWVAMVCGLIALLLLGSGIARRFPGAILMGGAVLGMLVLLEGGARLLAIFDSEVQGFPTNRSRMWRRQHVRLNQAGFRDVDHDTIPATGTRRLLMIGDSYAMGEGLNDPNDRFGALLGQKLGERTAHPYEVIHHARSDTHTLKHLEFLAEGLRYHPDVVVLLYVFNDIDYLHKVVARTALTEHPQGVLARLRPDRFIFVNSFAWQEVYVRIRQLRMNASTTASDDPYSDSATVAQHLGDLQRFVSQAQGGGARVLIVPIDLGVIASDKLRARYEKFLRDCSGAGLPVVSLRHAFDGQELGSLGVSKLDRHPNELANQLAMEAALPEIARLEGAGAP